MSSSTFIDPIKRKFERFPKCFSGAVVNKPLVGYPVFYGNTIKVASVRNLSHPHLVLHSGLSYPSIKLTGEEVLVGRGTYGTVHIYVDHHLAVKTMHSNRGFVDELRMTALASWAGTSGNHPARKFIVRLLGFCLSERKLVFRAYDCDLIKYEHVVRGALDESGCDALYRAVKGLIKAVVYLNIDHGITHCDIKPGNILININYTTRHIEKAVLADFSNAWLNPNSILNNHTMKVKTGAGMLIIGKHYSYGSEAPGIVLSHAKYLSFEIISDILNDTKVFDYHSVPTTDQAMEMDLYALGETLLYVIMSTIVGPYNQRKVPAMISLRHGDNDTSIMLETLAYRLTLKSCLVATLAKSQRVFDIPISCETLEMLEEGLINPDHRAELNKYYAQHTATSSPTLTRLAIPAVSAALLRLFLTLTDIKPQNRHCELIVYDRD
ncbi:tegument serine/threonine protein kinase [Testudinid alphaherpesvirus 3]|uniref:Serine/threonine kinase n=1 Tax=Testudinid alphaherpesvirus 3 TaxID=2560801 RepID=A0A0K1R198_9ALPH|nr:tegument serine/threonine protein kinase [Testudinid alphaherpesvirus 3]AIU39282.1 tegument serine/threonine protein kinase [Testudinid alphaherpesvirus 3]AIU39392.1 tegument serine/threonine protein kinase [Testudinid alphaherpesvirus 3]AKI81668.1 tegument serine/threonine protein kinase [Testudinid alphaherpesvirus 3]AKI81771.1 tegument serine/threonine protein kinase [Testudinid alphaherpesvirus 3]AKV40684.1 serine/threonine kinase [Testudinid alphaherpesvirus 3]